MAENALTGSIAAPGFYGLNSQDSSIQLNSGFALRAENCVIDKYGRVGARKGWTKVNSSATGSGDFRTIHEFVKSDGNLVFSAANNKIYGDIFGATTLTEYPVGTTNFHDSTTVSYSQSGTTNTVTTTVNHGYTTGDTVYIGVTSGTATSGLYVITVTGPKVFTYTAPDSKTTTGAANIISILTTYTITADNWQVANMPYGTGLNASAHAVWVQKDHIPLVLHRLGSATHMHTDGYGFQRLGDVGNLPVGYSVTTFMPNCAMSDFGRLWVARVSSGDTQTVYFSDLQNPTEWQTGTSGYLDISTVIPSGDPIVALAAHNGFLVIFCRRHIVIYSGATDPATMTLHDVIKGVGCIARDSVQSVAGTDILFLSETGVQSLQRVIQEKSLPFRDISKNVRDELVAAANSENEDYIKAVYSPLDAFYLISFPTSDITYCFDTRGTLQDGSARTTTWTQLVPTAFCVKQDKSLLVGRVSYVGKYTGNLDNEESYRMYYYTNYFDFQQPNTIKILKKINIVAIGGSAQPISMKWGFDYSFNYNSQTVVLNGSAVSEYGTAEYGIAEYSNGISLENIHANLTGSGKVLQLGFETNVEGVPVSIQKIDFSLKAGKTLI